MLAGDDGWRLVEDTAPSSGAAAQPINGVHH
jgi:hypothetical protein